MTDSAVAVDVHQPLDVLLHLTPEIALDLVVSVYQALQSRDFPFGQIFDPNVGINVRSIEDTVASTPTDAIDIGQPDLDTLISRNVNASNPGYILHLLSLR